MEEIFNPWEVQAIQQIPVPLYGDNDIWMWRHSKHGQFSVRGAYFVELMANRSSGPSTSLNSNNGVWKKVWRAKVAPKVKLFGWKLLHNGLPVNDNLARRGVIIDKQCPRCGDGEESVEHLLMQCDVSKQVWYFSPLRLDMEKVQQRRFREWIEFLATGNLEDEWWELFWMTCWQI